MRHAVAAMLALAAGATRPAAAQQPAPGKWRVQAALVVGGLDVKPVPLHALRLTSVADSAAVLEARTDLQGTAEGEAVAGDWMLSSASPVTVEGIAYSWAVPVVLRAGAVTEIRLDNTNAVVDSTAALRLATSGRRVEDAVTAYRRVRQSVFRIAAGLGHGSGFLVDSTEGLIVTNAHVVSNQVEASVVLDSVTRVGGRVLARDEEADVAVVQVHPSNLAGREPLLLADPRATGAIVESGERVFAVGYPLSQEQTLTTGIVSSIRQGAIISDVNINPGNSGGPLLNYSGTVVGMVTFGEARAVGSGIGGAVAATKIWPTLEAARLAADTASAPSARTLPSMPLEAMPLQQVQVVGDTADIRRLRRYEDQDIGAFDLSINTPVQLYIAMRAYDADVARDRRKREAQASLDPSQRYSSLREIREWQQYVGNPLAPVVQLVVLPKVGETTGSIFGRVLTAGLTGMQSKGTFKFRGDVRAVTLYRNGVPVEPLRGGTAPVEVYEDNQWISLKDVANRGLYMYSPLAFAPDSLGTPPSMVVVVEDLKKPKDPKCRELRRDAVANIWNDFAGWLESALPGRRFAVANPKADPKRFTSTGDATDSVRTVEPRRTWKLHFPGCTEFGY